MLSLLNAHQVQMNFCVHLKKLRKDQKISLKKLSDLSGVPYETLRKFERTGDISFRQFLLVVAKLDNLKNYDALTRPEFKPASIEDVINHA